MRPHNFAAYLGCRDPSSNSLSEIGSRLAALDGAIDVSATGALSLTYGISAISRPEASVQFEMPAPCLSGTLGFFHEAFAAAIST
jgi:hypothetical protein